MMNVNSHFGTMSYSLIMCRQISQLMYKLKSVGKMADLKL